MLDITTEWGQHAEQRLRSNTIAWLTTVGSDGRPYTSPVWFLWDGQTILIFSPPNRQKLILPIAQARGFWCRSTSSHLSSKGHRWRPQELRADGLCPSYKSGVQRHLPPHSPVFIGFPTARARIQASLGSGRAFWQGTFLFFRGLAKPESPLPMPQKRTRHSSRLMNARAFWLESVKNLRKNARVTLALDDTQEGEDVVIVEGTAELVDDPGLSAVLLAFADKYRERLEKMEWTPEEMAADYSQAIRVTPTKFKSWI